MQSYMVVTYVAGWVIIVGTVILVISGIVEAIKKAVVAHMERKYGCTEIEEFDDLEMANEAYDRLFAQYEDLFDQNNHLVAENATLERRVRRLENTCDDLESENECLRKCFCPAPPSEPKTYEYGHVETEEAKK